MLSAADQITFLGTGGFHPNGARETTSYFLRVGDRAIVFDCGTGIQRLPEVLHNAGLDDRTPVAVFLSHYHLDHSVGVTWLLSLLPNPVTVYYPASPLVDVAETQGLAALTSQPLFSLPYAQFPARIRFEELVGDLIRLDGVEIRLLAQSHAGGSVGFRLGDDFAFITDTDVTDSDDHVRFLAGVELAVIDCYYDSSEYDDRKKRGAQHGHPGGVASVAQRAGINRTFLAHLNPRYEPERLEAMLKVAQHITNAELAVDLFTVRA